LNNDEQAQQLFYAGISGQIRVNPGKKHRIGAVWQAGTM